MATDGVFISYRREETAGFAGRLYDRLVARFGRERVFMDVEGIDPGVDFVEAIESAVASCRALVVVIGPRWSSVDDKNGNRRLDDPQDFVRLETAAALKRSIRVLPVLVNDAAMPREDELPDELKALVRRQAIEINHKHWESSTSDLLAALARILDEDDGRESHQKASAPRSWVRWGALAGVPVLGVAAYVAWMSWQPQPTDTSVPAGMQQAVPQFADETASSPSEDERTSTAESQEEALPPLILAEPDVRDTAAVAVAPDTSPRTTEPAAAPEPRKDVSPEPQAQPKPQAAPATTVPPVSASRPTQAAESRPAVVASPPAEVSTAVRESPMARTEPPSKLPQAGEQWTYAVRGLWATNRNRDYVYTVEAAQGRTIRESMSESTATGVRSLATISWDGSRPEVIQRQGKLPEFNPYLIAFDGVADGSRWRGVSTPSYDGRWDGWNTTGRVVGLESVTVPAGEYRAWKADIWSNRNATGGPTIAGLEPVSVRYEIWFAPGEKRFVKLVRTVKSAAGGNLERDTFELRSVKRP